MSCKAITPQGQCKLQPEAQSRFCSMHEMQQSKSLKTYKRLSREYLAIQEKFAFPDQEDIQHAKLPVLQEWQALSRRRWILADRCLHAREWHHKIFCQGGDEGHLQFCDFLQAQKKACEKFSVILDDFAYKSILAQQEIAWLRDERRDPLACEKEKKMEEPKSCADHGKSATRRKGHGKKKSNPPQPTKVKDSDDDIFSALCSKHSEPECAQKCNIVTRLDTLLDHHQKLTASDSFKEQRRLIIEQVFRHIIAFEPVLLVRSQAFESVRDFVHSELSLGELRLLSEGLKFAGSTSLGKLDVTVIHQCILAALCGQKASSPSVQLLGGSVSRHALDAPLDPDGWCHLYHFIGCAGCGRRGATSFSDLSWALSHMGPDGAFPLWATGSQAEASVHLQRAGISVVAACNPSVRLERVKSARKQKPIFVERQHRCFVMLRTSPGPEADALVEALSGHPDKCIVVTRTGKEEALWQKENYNSCDLWTTRVRSGSKAERAGQTWSIEGSLILKTAFDWFISNNTEGKYREPFKDVLNVLILSRSDFKDCDAFLGFISRCFSSSADESLAQESESLIRHTGGHEATVTTRVLFD